MTTEVPYSPLPIDQSDVDPFSAVPGSRLYRTGDAVVRDAAGAVQFRGRQDLQVKIRGHRIEPGGIGAVLSSHPAVTAAVVVPDTAEDGTTSRLIAYVVASAADDGLDLVERLRGYLSARLPEYEVPAGWAVVDALPLTPNGKVDRGALPAVVHDVRTAAGREPRDDVERSLAAIWVDVVATGGPVARDDDFFAIGGDSLKALTLRAAVRKRLGVRLPVSVVLSNPTVAAMAELVRLDTGERPESPLIRIQRGRRDRAPLFCVHPGNGSVMSYLPLARHLGPNRPVYGLEDVTRDSPGASVDELAARYVQELRRAWPTGPYLLAGWSFGGLVAYEMAHRLRSVGADVPVVALLDTGAPSIVAAYREVEDALIQGILAGELLERPQTEVPALTEQLAGMPPSERSDLVSSLLAQTGRLPSYLEDGWFDHELRVFRGRVEAAARYSTPVADGPVQLLRARTESLDQLRGLPPQIIDGLRDDTLGWREYCPQLSVVPVPGEHGTLMLEPHVRHVADAVQGLIGMAASPEMSRQP